MVKDDIKISIYIVSFVIIYIIITFALFILLHTIFRYLGINVVIR